MARELKSIHKGEEFWWNSRLIKSENDLHDRYHKFVQNFNIFENNELFAYEGLFDKKEKNVFAASPRLERSRFEKPNILAQLDQSRIGDDKYKIKLNSSNVMNINDGSINARSSVSDAAGFGPSLRQNENVEIKK